MNGREQVIDMSFLDTSSKNVSEEMILDYLGQIISEVYLMEVHGFTAEQIRSHYEPHNPFDDTQFLKKY